MGRDPKPPIDDVVVVPNDAGAPKPPRTPQTPRVVKQPLGPPDPGSSGPRPAQATETKIDPSRTEQSSPIENDVGTLKPNHKPLSPNKP